jgi:hypothetical protein
VFGAFCSILLGVGITIYGGFQFSKVGTFGHIKKTANYVDLDTNPGFIPADSGFDLAFGFIDS